MRKCLGMLLVALSVTAANACDSPNHQAAQPSPTPPVINTSPRPISEWASFGLGADQPHQTLADGLQITDIQTRSDRKARDNDQLSVQYILWLSDGRQVDSSDSHGGFFKFTLGRGEVIKGWDEGVVGMGVAGIRRLTIPPALAYGARGVADNSGGYAIPPNATLVFIVHLVSLTGPGP